MTKPCSICTSKVRAAIEAQISLGQITLAELGRRTGCSVDALGRHKRHMPRITSGELESMLDAWSERMNALYLNANASGDWKTALEAGRAGLNILAQKQQVIERKAGNAGDTIES